MGGKAINVSSDCGADSLESADLFLVQRKTFLEPVRVVFLMGVLRPKHLEAAVWHADQTIASAAQQPSRNDCFEVGTRGHDSLR